MQSAVRGTGGLELGGQNDGLNRTRTPTLKPFGPSDTRSRFFNLILFLIFSAIRYKNNEIRDRIDLKVQ